LIKRKLYLVPNSLVVSRGCPHSCDFCYKDSFFKGGKSFYSAPLAAALREIDSLAGRHLFFLDDNILGDQAYARALLEALLPRRRVWQGAATLLSLRDPELVELAAKSGCGSLFIGFESINKENLARHGKRHNLSGSYEEAIRLLHANGIMVNGSFVFGMDADDADSFSRTVDWALENGIETATFHILTPYPGTALFDRYRAAGRIESFDWSQYDTRHLVFKHPKLSRKEMEALYWKAYSDFYSWGSILRGAAKHESLSGSLRHFGYSAAWKKCEWLWRLVIEMKRLDLATPFLEAILEGRLPFRQAKEPSLEPSARAASGDSLG
jgi:radical SAM superfamily enzyme YgiQ (UPF0313 family)